jgi:hypothetical protein
MERLLTKVMPKVQLKAQLRVPPKAKLKETKQERRVK